MLRRQAKGWMFTINNPMRPMTDPPIDFTGFRRPPTYAIYQLELGENGTFHLQGYVYFDAQIKGLTLSRSLGCQPHLEPRRGKHSEVYNFKLNPDEIIFRDFRNLVFPIFIIIRRKATVARMIPDRTVLGPTETTVISQKAKVLGMIY